MSFTAISMTASLIRDTDSENLPLSARQELLGHIDSCVENAQQFLKTPESKTIHGGLIEGFQTVLASFYSRHDRHADAENLFTEALVYQKRELGNFHVETMCTMNELGALYLKMGDVKNAEFMLTESLQAKERALGPDHPRTLNTVNNIGNLYSLQLQLDKATEMYQRVLEGYTKLYGPKDRSVAEAWNNLGEISMKQGRFSVAQEQFVTALETVRGSAGGDTAFILYLKSNLALMYKFENLFNLAKDLYSEVIEGRSVMLGVGHSSTLQSMCEMGDVFLAEGNKQAAEVWYVKGKASVERRKKTERELEAGEKAVKTKMEDDVGFYPIWTDLSSGHNHPGGHKKPDSPNAPFPTSTIPRLAEDDDDTDDGMDLDPYPPSRQTSRVDEDHIMSNIPSVSRALQQPSQPFLIDRVGHDDRQSWGTFSPARAYGAPPSFQGSYGSSWRYSTQAPPRAQPLIHSPSNGNPTPHNGSFNRLSSQPSPGRSPNASLRPSWNDGRSGYYRQQTGALAFDPPSRVGWDSPQATSYGAAADRLGWNYSQVGSYGAGADQLGMGSNIRISPSPCEYIERGGVCLHNINHSWLLNSEGWS
jgi:tetratricopeptide (TPR) repeat protein